MDQGLKAKGRKIRGIIEFGRGKSYKKGESRDLEKMAPKETVESGRTSEITSWLLEPENPSVRSFALRDLCGLREADPRVREAKAAIMTHGPVPRILARQKGGGSWGAEADFYERSKYKGTVWTLILLAELGADGADPRVHKACEFLLSRSQDRESGGFAYTGSVWGGGYPSGVIPCLTGNMVWSMLRLGLQDDPRLKKAIDWLVRFRRFDDGDGPAPRGAQFFKREPCYGRHTCHMGVVKTLKALGEIPKKRRTAEIRQTIEEGTEYLLRHHLFKRSHDLAAKAKPWMAKLGFPLMWRTDALEMLDVLAGFGCRDDRMSEAIDLVLSKRDEEGRWRLEKGFEGRLQVPLEKENHPSKWVTLSALRALKRAGPEFLGPADHPH